MMHEAACHNREKNGTTDFGQTVMACQNRVTCWLEQLPNKVDLTSWISTVACDHRKILPIFGLQRGYQCLETHSNKWDGLHNRFE